MHIEAPNFIVKKFKDSWRKVDKISFEEFYKRIVKSDDRRYWVGEELEYYYFYLSGDPGRRYPELPITPTEILSKVIEAIEQQLKKCDRES
jgi:hypothetical protein